VNAIFNRDEFMKNLNLVLDSARRVRIPIVYTRAVPFPQGFEPPFMEILRSRANYRRVQGDMGLAVNPRRGEVIINKSTMSAFIGTNFELLLRNSNRTTVIITGIATEMGVESTARDALNRGFIPVVVTDAVSSSDKESHERSLANMSKIAITLTSEELRKTWITKE
jgi:nicotinamidase-related amidase